MARQFLIFTYEIGMRSGKLHTELFLCAVFAMVLLGRYSAIAQGSAGSDASLETRFIVDMPTAGLLHDKSMALTIEMYQDGGMLLGASFGLFNRIMGGISYGGTGLIGTGNPDWNPAPGVDLRLRFLDESYALPALALGFDSQGKEPYLHNPDRYTIKSPGFYLVASKNYQAYGSLSIHGGVNYSLERADHDSDPNLFAGLEKSIGGFMSLLAEYSLGANDSNHDARGRGRGYLNTAIAISAGNGLTLEFSIKDIFHNQQDVSLGNRTLAIDFVHPL